MAMPQFTEAALAELQQIAMTHLRIDTLDTQMSDSKDFHDLAVWSIKAALEAAYLAGQVDHMKR